MNSKFKIIKILIIALFIIIVSCKNKSVKLPVLGIHGIQDTIYNHSKIWLFYSVAGNDTIAELNKNNKITNTHLIFNIDRRLSLKHIIPAIKKIQEKKENPSMHDNGEITHTYYSYVDSASNKLSLILFDSVHYKTTGTINLDSLSLTNHFKHLKINFTKNNIAIDGTTIDITEVNDYLESQLDSTKLKIHLSFNKELPYQDYIHLKALLQKSIHDSIRIDNVEYVN